MDLTPFFQNVDRIATALETIARNTAPTITRVEQQPLLSAAGRDRVLAALRGEDEPKVDTAGTGGRVRPRAWSQVEAEAKVQGEVLKGDASSFEGVAEELAAPSPATERALNAILEIYQGGTQTANGVAKALRERGIPHPRGLQWHNISAKKLMDQLSLESVYGLPRPAAVPSPAVEPQPESAAPPVEPGPETAPAPAKPGPEAAAEPVKRAFQHTTDPAEKDTVNQAFVAKEFQSRPRHGDHMNLRGPLSDKTGANLEAHEQAKAADRALIEEALAAGKVTKLPAYIDSHGYDHSGKSTLNTRRAGYVGAAVRQAVK